MTATVPGRDEGHAVPPKDERLLLEIGAVLLLFAASLGLMPLSSMIGGPPLAYLSPFIRMATVLLVVTWLLRRRGESWVTLGLRRPRWGRAALVTLLGYVGAMALLALAVMPALRAAGYSVGEPAAFAALRGSPALLAYWLATSWIVAAFGEELLARGWLLTRLERLFGGGRTALVAAVVGQALIFGLGHAWNGVPGMVLAGTMGLVLALVYLFAGRNLWPAILIHGIVDSQSFVAIYYGVSAGAS